MIVAIIADLSSLWFIVVVVVDVAIVVVVAAIAVEPQWLTRCGDELFVPNPVSILSVYIVRPKITQKARPQGRI